LHLLLDSVVNRKHVFVIVLMHFKSHRNEKEIKWR